MMMYTGANLSLSGVYWTDCEIPPSILHFLGPDAQIEDYFLFPLPLFLFANDEECDEHTTNGRGGVWSAGM